MINYTKVTYIVPANLKLKCFPNKTAAYQNEILLTIYQMHSLSLSLSLSLTVVFLSPYKNILRAYFSLICKKSGFKICIWNEIIKCFYSFKTLLLLLVKYNFISIHTEHKDKYMSPVPPVFHTVETVNIGLKYVLRVGTSI